MAYLFDLAFGGLCRLSLGVGFPLPWLISQVHIYSKNCLVLIFMFVLSLKKGGVYSGTRS